MHYKDTLVQLRLFMNDRYEIPSTIKMMNMTVVLPNFLTFIIIYSPLLILNSQEKLNSIGFLSTIPIEFVINS